MREAALLDGLGPAADVVEFLHHAAAASEGAPPPLAVDEAFMLEILERAPDGDRAD
jgi:hypothetical protein